MRVSGIFCKFHANASHCARCTSISRTGSSLMWAERHRRRFTQFDRQWIPDGPRPRQRRPTDRACYVDTAERWNGAGWQIVDVDWKRRRPECSSWPDTLVTPTDHDSQLVLHAFWNVVLDEALQTIVVWLMTGGRSAVTDWRHDRFEMRCTSSRV